MEEKIYKKIEKLEKERTEYLEADDKVTARRKEKQIEELKKELELFELKDIKKDLELYKKFVDKKGLKQEFMNFMIIELARN